MASNRALPFTVGRTAQQSTRLAFFIAGFGMAAWAPLVPFVKARSGLSEGALGLLLLCLGAGSIVAMPLAGALAGRFGCRRVLVAATGLICLTLPILAAASNLPLLIAALFLFGAGVGSVDCVVNIQAVIVERASRRPMMSGFHGLFSVGGIIGAAGVSALLSLGASPLVAASCVVAGIVVVLVKATPHLLPYGGEGEGSAFARPQGVVLFIGILCFIVFLTEGAALDWSAVFLTSMRDVAPSYAGLGYAAFAGAMTLGRLTGDAMVRRLGRQRVIIGGSFCAAIGLALATLVPVWEAGILGYALVGAGCSNIVPVLYTAVGRQTVMPEHAAVPAITTLGYAGILAGPAAIGFVAQATSLSVALLAVAVLLLVVAAGGRILRV
jgi:MFS family permease